MKCPKCDNMETKVTDSRTAEEWKAIRRRRACEYCDFRFTTYEKVSVTDLVVVKSDGRKELYDRAKLKKSLMLGFAKRTYQLTSLNEMIAQLENKRSWLKEIPSKQIGEDILAQLKDTDPVAYVRFASVYKHFDNLEDFKDIIEQ